MRKSHWIISGAVALTALLGATTAAHAGNNHQPDVRWSVTVGSPAPVYVQRGPVFPQPYPVYRVDDRYGHHHHHHRHHDRYREPTRWDRDGDGIPNRHDRVYNPRWDVDGDGIPNRHDRDGRGHGHWRR